MRFKLINKKIVRQKHCKKVNLFFRKQEINALQFPRKVSC